MKRIVFLLFALVASMAWSTTLTPIQLLNPAGSSSGQVIFSTGAASAPTWGNVSGTGTVTSVGLSAGTTGLTVSGSPITGAGTFSLGGTLGVANGGTGLASPGTSGNVLTSNGTAWVSQAGGGGGAGVTSFNTRTGAVTLTSSDVSAASGALQNGAATFTTIGASGNITLTNGSGNKTIGAASNNFFINNSANTSQILQLTDAGNMSNAGTFATGNFTSTGTGSFTGTLNASGNDALLYVNSTTQSIPNATVTPITGWTQKYDRLNANFNPTNGMYEAPQNGYYLVSGQVTFQGFSAAVSNTFQAIIAVNGGVIISGIVSQQTSSAIAQSVNVSGVIFAAAGTTINLSAYQNTGSSVTLNGSPSVTYFSVSRIP
jgi:hypothetical protein